MAQAKASHRAVTGRDSPRKRVSKKSKPTQKRRAKKVGGVQRCIRRALLLSWSFGWRGLAIFVVILSVATGFYFTKLPPMAELLEVRSQGSVTLQDHNQLSFAWRGSQFGGEISSEDVSPFLKNAVIAAEDKRFFDHFGISLRGIAGAIVINLREGRGPLQGHGGSTITQQVAKLMCLGKEYHPESGVTMARFERDCRRTTLWRKIREIPFALALEIKYSKNEILTIYLNRVYLGAGATGFEAASQRYFDVSIRHVNPAQSAMLAGLLVAPSVYAPTRNMGRAVSRANLIVSLMEEQGFLSVSEAREARAYHAKLSRGSAAKAGSYFADWIMETVPDFLMTDLNEDVILKTTFDLRVQKAVDEALVHVFETKVKAGSRAEAAIVVMTKDGAVRAMTGGRNPRAEGQFNRATQALRQTGSAFKPFVFAAALEAGYRPNDSVLDEPVSFRVPGSGIWRPKNYEDKYEGSITLTEALTKSSNVIAARLSEEVGRDKVKEMAQKFGIQSQLADGPALALGASESTLIEMTGAYASILNGGIAVEPFGLIELRLKNEKKPLFQGGAVAHERAVSQKIAWQLVDMMSQVVTRGTGQRAALSGRDVAGKTGTTQGARDAWFIGFSADYVAGVWMGYDDNTPLTGVTGAGLPAEIWREAMQRIHQGMVSRPLPTSASASPANEVASRQ